MRILMIDIDTLRPDHMGCYGYGRSTTPCIDSIAAEGMVFTRCYTPNAPCLPSRAALATGMYGIHSGVVGHGGTAADLFLQGQSREFRDEVSENNLFNVFRKAGCKTASISTFAERHSAWWFNAGFNEVFNVGQGGMESAEEVTPVALKWLEDNGRGDSWFLHFHLWDPHTPYRAPAAFGNPFRDQPLPDPWITGEVFDEHYRHIGPHGAREINMWNDETDPQYPRHPGSLENLDDVKEFIDGYDCGVRYADDNVALVVAKLKALGIYEDTAIIVTSDHGENLGELGIYGEHATADHPCCHIPLVIRWPGVCGPGVADSLCLNLDLAPTVAELLGVPPYRRWDGASYAHVLRGGGGPRRTHAVLNQCAHVCQRSVVFDGYLYIRTLHGGYHLFNDEMLFDIQNDPHQTTDLAKARPDLANRGARLILDWEYEMMKTSATDVDPMWTVLREGGPLHARGQLPAYLARLRATGRAGGAAALEAKYGEDGLPPCCP